jgi:NAD+ kinase
MKFCFVASHTPKAQDVYHDLTSRYENFSLKEADVIIIMGGDGFLLHSLHNMEDVTKPVYGINCGTRGFLLNSFKKGSKLEKKINEANETKLFPLKMTVHTTTGEVIVKHAINEVSLLRQTPQAAKISIHVDGTTRMEELICDGVLVSTPAGSTAYNFSAHGPILPLGSPLFALTPISVMQPRRWRGALLNEKVNITFTAKEVGKRPISATADHQEVRDVALVQVEQDTSFFYKVLFDPHHNLEERILLEQFQGS